MASTLVASLMLLQAAEPPRVKYWDMDAAMKAEPLTYEAQSFGEDLGAVATNWTRRALTGPNPNPP